MITFIHMSQLFLLKLQHSIICIYFICFIHSFIAGHLHCFHSVPTVNNAAINMKVCPPSQDSDLNSFGIYTQRCKIAGSCGSRIFNILKTSILLSMFISRKLEREENTKPKAQKKGRMKIKAK